MLAKIRFLVCFIVTITLLTNTSVLYAKTNKQQNHTATTNLASNQKILTSTFTLKDLLGNSKIVLNEVQPSFVFYPPIPSQWQLIGSKLHLELNYSPILDKSSALTLFINDDPISSIQLNADKNHEQTWDIDLSKALISAGKFPKIKVIASMRADNQPICNFYDTSSMWLKISPKSTINYQYTLLDYVSNLKAFPSPFIKIQNPQQDITTLVFPDKLTNEEVIQALQTTNYLASLATWRGLKINVTNLASLSQTEKERNDFIFIGTTSWLKTLSNLFPNLPLTINADDKFQDSNQQISNSAIMMAHSPWSAYHATLLVIGNTSNDILKALANMQQQPLPYTTPNNYMLTPEQLPNTDNNKINWEKTSFKALGYNDQTVQELGVHTLNYTLHLPNDKTPELLVLNIDLSHSPLVTAEGSSVTLLMNKSLVNSVKLNKANENKETWRVVIPKNKLLPGDNSIDLIFDLHMQNEKPCASTNKTGTWTTIHNSSVIKASLENQPVKVSLSSFPLPLSANTLLIIPDDLKPETQQAMISLVAKLGANFKNEANQLKIISENQVTPELLAEKHVILLGKTSNDQFIKDTISKMSISYLNNADRIKEIHKQLLENHSPLGLIELSQSPWNKQKILLLIISNDENKLTSTINTLIAPDAQAKLTGNIAVIKSDNKIDAFDTWPTGKLVTQHYIINGLMLVAVLILSITLLAIIIVLRHYRKQYKNKNDHR